MNTFGKSCVSPLGPPSTAIQTLLQRVANLCVLGQVPEDVAAQMFREAYADARVKTHESVGGKSDSGVDAFVGAQVLSEWHQNSGFLDRDGNPRTLSVSAGEFGKLCATASGQSRPERVLDLLDQAGAVTIEGDRVSPHRRELIMDYAHPAAVTRAIHLSAEFAATLHHNLSRSVQEPGLFERTVVSTKLTHRQVPSLLAYLSVHGQSFLEDLDAWMSARESTTSGPSLGVGVYLFVGDKDSQHRTANGPAP